MGGINRQPMSSVAISIDRVTVIPTPVPNIAGSLAERFRS
jgi:hypothetical protein